MATETDYSRWIGSSETAQDEVTAGPLDRLEATLDRDPCAHAPGDAIPPLAHWLFFLPRHRQSELGEDGHARRGGFLPDAPDLPRRMWAGSRIAFPGAVRVGMRLQRRSTVRAASRKQGASGPLLFVTVGHEIAEPGGETLIEEEHDIVYRPGAAAAAPKPPAAQAGQWRRELVADACLLFRYSALTFNGHRIHYDRDYVVNVEHYPGLVVHGPLIATLLIDLLRRNMPEAAIRSFAFRAVSPVFAGDALGLNGSPPDDDGKVALWADNGRGGLAMKAEAALAGPGELPR